MNGRARVAAVACGCGVAALVTMTIWVASWPDTTLARWSAVAAVVSGLAAILALAVAIVPLWPRGDSADEEGEEKQQRPSTTVTQNIHANGQVNAVGEGSQLNMGIRPPSDGQ